jgi:hypothetical protein
MLVRIALILLILMSGFPGKAWAARFSGEYLLHVCGNDKEGKELVPGGHIACQAYIAGVLDYHNLIRSLGTSPSVDFCIPETVDMNTLQKNVVSYLLKNRQQHAKFVAAPAVAMAMLAYYPCGGGRKKK